MARWYQHRYHTLSTHGIVFAIIPKVPRFLQPPIACVTALVFFLLLGNERRAVMRNMRAITGCGKIVSRWKAYRVFYSFCDLIVSYCYVPYASHSELLGMLAAPDRGAETIDRCLADGNGLIVWTAHLGNFDHQSLFEL